MKLSNPEKLGLAVALFALLASGAASLSPANPAINEAMFLSGAIGFIWLALNHFNIRRNVSLLILGPLLLAVTGRVLYVWLSIPYAEVIFDVRNSNYPDGIDVAGIKWSNNLTDTRVIIKNDSDDEYDDIDFLVQTDLIIQNIAQEPGIAKCYFDLPSGLPKLLNMTGTDKSGKAITIPLEPVPNIQSISSLYRGRCDKLPGKSEIEIVLALSQFKFGPGGTFTSNPLNAPRVNPAWIVVGLTYQLKGAVQKQEYRKCFVRDCPGLERR